MEFKGSVILTEKYYKTECPSKSLLAKYLGPNPPKIQEESDLYYSEKKPLELGSLVDAALTMQSDYFEQYYYIQEGFEKPVPTIMSVIKQIYDNNIHITDTVGVLEVCNLQNYQVKWKDETRINKINEKGLEYYNFLLESDGKYIISAEEYRKSNDICASLLLNKETSDYFQDHEDLIILNQVPLYYKVYITRQIGVDNANNPIFGEVEVPLKSLLDRVIINPTDTDVTLGKSLLIPARSILPLDIKTTGRDLYEFEDTCKRFRYDVQADMYHYALENFEVLDLEEDAWNYLIPKITTEALKTLNILPVHFIVSSTANIESPFAVKFDAQTLGTARWGSDFYNNDMYIDANHHDVQIRRNKKLYGWINAIDNYLHFKETGSKKPRNMPDGVIKLNLW